MTPLNPILNQATMLKQKIITLYLDRFGVLGNTDVNEENIEGINFQNIQFVVKNSFEAKTVIGQLLAIE
jgi:hypothetical protein